MKARLPERHESEIDLSDFTLIKENAFIQMYGKFNTNSEIVTALEVVVVSNSPTNPKVLWKYPVVLNELDILRQFFLDNGYTE